MSPNRSSTGYSFIDLVFVLGLSATLTGFALPEIHTAMDAYRTAGAARYLTTRFARARMEAVGRSEVVAVRFTLDTAGYAYGVYVDGDRDGVHANDIANGIDTPLTPVERLPDNFHGVDFAVPAGLPPVESGPPTDGDPIKLGVSSLLSFSSLGTSSSGSVYVRGRGGSQYVIRIFGETGKVRMLKFNAGVQQWRPL